MRHLLFEVAVRAVSAAVGVAVLAAALLYLLLLSPALAASWLADHHDQRLLP